MSSTTSFTIEPKHVLATVLLTLIYAILLDTVWFFAFGAWSNVYRPAIQKVTGGTTTPIHRGAALLSWSVVSLIIVLSMLYTYSGDSRPLFTVICAFLGYALFNFTLKAMFPAYPWGAVFADIFWGTLLSYKLYFLSLMTLSYLATRSS
jgi:hypothetical protein